MDVNELLEQLRQEHTYVTEAILSIERLAANGQKRRGRPPKWLIAAKASPAPAGLRRNRRRPTTDPA